MPSAAQQTKRSYIRNLSAKVVGKVRRETLHGKEYIVAPLTMIVPGVLNGSRGPLYYPAEEVAASAEAWDHMPIVVDHPVRNGMPVRARDPQVLEQQGIGYVFRSRIGNGGKLQAEGWFEIDKANKVDKRIVSRLLSGNPVPLSTGLITDNVPMSGFHQESGRNYTHVARNYKPDHLAVFVDKVGACSLDDGCGVLLNTAHPKKRKKLKRVLNELQQLGINVGWTDAARKAAAIARHAGGKRGGKGSGKPITPDLSPEDYAAAEEAAYAKGKAKVKPGKPAKGKAMKVSTGKSAKSPKEAKGSSALGDLKFDLTHKTAKAAMQKSQKSHKVHNLLVELNELIGNDFRGHAGRKGKRGGSVARQGSTGSRIGDFYNKTYFGAAKTMGLAGKAARAGLQFTAGASLGSLGGAVFGGIAARKLGLTSRSASAGLLFGAVSRGVKPFGLKKKYQDYKSSGGKGNFLQFKRSVAAIKGSKANKATRNELLNGFTKRDRRHSIKLLAANSALTANSLTDRSPAELVRLVERLAITNAINVLLIGERKMGRRLKDEARERIINQLIYNCECGKKKNAVKGGVWNEEDREELETMNDERLVALNSQRKLAINAGKSPKEKEEETGKEKKKEGKETTTNEEGEKLLDVIKPSDLKKGETFEPVTVNGVTKYKIIPKQKAPTDEEWLAQAPKSVQRVVNSAIKREEAHRDKLIKKITANGSEFEESELEVMNVDLLEKLAKSLKGKAGRVNNEDDDSEWEEDDDEESGAPRNRLANIFNMAAGGRSRGQQPDPDDAPLMPTQDYGAVTNTEDFSKNGVK